MILYYFKNIYQSLKFNSFRTFLTGLGVLIGVCSLIIILTLSDSFKENMTSKINNKVIDIGLTNSIEVSGDFNTIMKMPQIKKSISSITNDIKSVISFKQAKSKNLLSYIHMDKIQNNVEYEFNDTVIVDKGINFQNEVGNIVIVRKCFQFEPTIKLNDFIVINGISYKVIGYTSQEGKEGIPLLYFPENLSKNIKPSNYEENPIFELIVNEKNKNETIEQVLENLNKNIPLGYKFINFTKETNISINEAIKSISIFVALISFISIVVAIINVANIMYISILEKTSEIAIYRALGMKKIHVQLLFLMESVFIVLSFSILGYITGIFITYIILNIFRMKIYFNFFNIFIIIIASILIGSIAGYRPAKIASNVNVATILK